MLGALLLATPAAATITGTWVAEIRHIAADPDYPVSLTPNLSIGDRITYSYEVLGQDLATSTNIVHHFVSPPPSALTDFGSVFPTGPPSLRSSDDRTSGMREIAVAHILEFDLADLGVVPPPPRNAFFGFFDISASLDCSMVACEPDVLPLGSFDFAPATFDPQRPFDGPHVFIEFNFQGGGAGPVWYAAGPVLSVTQTLPEPGSSLLLVSALVLWCTRVAGGARP